MPAEAQAAGMPPRQAPEQPAQAVRAEAEELAEEEPRDGTLGRSKLYPYPAPRPLNSATWFVIRQRQLRWARLSSGKCSSAVTAIPLAPAATSMPARTAVHTIRQIQDCVVWMATAIPRPIPLRSNPDSEPTISSPWAIFRYTN